MVELMNIFMIGSIFLLFIFHSATSPVTLERLNNLTYLGFENVIIPKTMFESDINSTVFISAESDPKKLDITLENLELVKNYESSVSLNIYVHEGFAYVFDFSTLRILNASDPSDPELIKTDYFEFLLAMDVEMDENYFYIVGYYVPFLAIIEVSHNDPTDLNLVGVMEDIRAFSVQVMEEDDYIITTNTESEGSNNISLVVIDVTDKSNPSIIGETEFVTNGDPDIKVYNIIYTPEEKYVYLVDTGGMLYIFDLSSPTTPELIHSCYTGVVKDTEFEKTYIDLSSDHILYVAGYDGMKVFNVSNTSSSCVSIGQLTGRLIKIELYDDENYLLAYGEDTFYLLDVTSNVSHPTVLDTYIFDEDMGDDPFGMNFYLDQSSGVVWVPYLSGGMYVLQINISNITQLYHSNSEFLVRGLGIRDEYMYMVDDTLGFAVLKMEDVKNLEVVGTLEMSSLSSIDVSDIRELIVVGERVLLGDYSNGLFIINVQNKSDPFIESSITNLGCQVERFVVDEEETYVYLVTDCSFEIISISNFSEPERLGSISKFGDDASVRFVDISVVHGEYAYLTDQNFGLRVIHVKNKTHPSEVVGGGLENVHEPRTFGYLSCYSHPNSYCYVLGGMDYINVDPELPNIFVVDISQPSSPLLVGNYFQTDGREYAALDFVKVGNRAFVGSLTHGLQVLSLEEEGGQPVLVEEYGPDLTSFVCVVDNFIFTTAGLGLKVFSADLLMYIDPAYSHFGCARIEVSVIGEDSSGKAVEKFYIFDPVEEECSAHGICLEEEKCFCLHGYSSVVTFGTCSEYSCFGILYDDEQNVCSGRGSCSGVDECECGDFEGSSCETWSCDQIDFKDSETCNGWGDCVSPEKCVCRGGRGGRYCETNYLYLTVMLPILLSFGVVVTLAFLSISCCLVCVIVFCLISVLFLCLASSVVLLGCLFRLVIRNRKFGKLKNFDLLLKEQKLEVDSTHAKLRFRKELFEVQFEDIQTIRILGEGGSSSVVFLAKWEGRRVAFKCFKTRYLMSDQDKFEEFEREVELFSSLAHPNIVRFFGACLSPPRVGILMEYCSKGEILEFVMRWRDGHSMMGYPTYEKIRLLTELSHSMEFLHSKNIIHRDLKCENVLISEDEHSKLMDFGLSRLVNSMKVNKTTRIGTSFYMSPEMVRGDENYDEKCDVFSYAILCYMVFTELVNPYGENLDFQVEFRVSNDPSFRPKVSNLNLASSSDEFGWLEEMIVSCWDNDPSERMSFKEITQLLGSKGTFIDVREKKNEIVEDVQKREDVQSIPLLKEDGEGLNKGEGNKKKRIEELEEELRISRLEIERLKKLVVEENESESDDESSTSTD